MTNRERIEAYDNREFARFLASVAGYGGDKEEVDFWEYWLKKDVPQKSEKINMADIELVIKIPQELYKDIKEHGLCGYCSDREIVSKAISNGIPLPKHGRLIDADALIRWLKIYDERYNERFAKTPLKDIPMYDLGKRNRNDNVISILDGFSTIIEADKESGE